MNSLARAFRLSLLEFSRAGLKNTLRRVCGAAIAAPFRPMSRRCPAEPEQQRVRDEIVSGHNEIVAAHTLHWVGDEIGTFVPFASPAEIVAAHSHHEESVAAAEWKHTVHSNARPLATVHGLPALQRAASSAQFPAFAAKRVAVIP